MMREDVRRWLHLTAFGYVAGFVDVWGFIRFQGVFTAHVTGNIALLGVDMFQRSQAMVPRLFAIPTFIVSAAITRLVATALGRLGIAVMRPLLALEIVLLAAVLATVGAQPPAPSLLPAMLAVAAMGVQATAPTIGAKWSVLTTAMTSNLSQGTAALMDLLLPGPDQVPGRPQRQVAERGLPLIAFAAGAASGGAGEVFVGAYALALPILVLALVAVSPPSPPARSAGG